eukprot:scaffold2044_cov305-Pavlova_lutheri.AAC.4
MHVFLVVFPSIYTVSVRSWIRAGRLPDDPWDDDPSTVATCWTAARACDRVDSPRPPVQRTAGVFPCFWWCWWSPRVPFRDVYCSPFASLWMLRATPRNA